MEHQSHQAGIAGEIDVDIPERHRLHIRMARAWAMARGRPIDAVALAILVLAKEECCDAPLRLWLLDDLAEFVWGHVTQWCAAEGVRRPPDLAEVLWLYLTFLDETGQLEAGSDDLPSLRASLMAYGGLDRFGRSRASRRASAADRRKAAKPKRQAATPVLAPIIPLHRANRPNGPLGRRPRPSPSRTLGA